VAVLFLHLLHLLQDGRSLQHSLTSTRAALKQADVRIAILDERCVTLQQVRRQLAAATPSAEQQQRWCRPMHDSSAETARCCMRVTGLRALCSSKHWRRVEATGGCRICLRMARMTASCNLA
jgi:hypothetical protein